MIETAFKTSNVLMTEKNGLITVGERSRTIILIAFVELAIGILSYVASRIRLSGDGGIERFCFWEAVIILPLAGLMLMIGLYQSLTTKTVFNCNSGKMRRGRKIYDFSQIENLSLERKVFAGGEIFFLTVVVNGKGIKLISETSKDTLAEALRFLNEKLAVREGAATTVKEANTPASSWVGRHFAGILLLALGLIWTGTGFYFIPNLIFTSPGNLHGSLVWPLGIWIAGLGCGDLIGLPVSRIINGGYRRSKIAMLIMILYFGSYFLICWR
jgi:hypothetical protein